MNRDKHTRQPKDSSTLSKLQKRNSEEALLKVDRLVTSFKVDGQWFGRKHLVQAVSGVSFEIYPKETYALVGESGCGKTTIARTIVGLEKSSHGTVTFKGQRLESRSRVGQKTLAQRIQMIFQDPYSSLNPKKRVGKILEESLQIIDSSVPAPESREKVLRVLKQVGFQEADAQKFPSQFSGGQRQRIGIARALIADPELVICDESLSALDVSIQGEILALLQLLKEEFNLAYLFVSHDLSIVRQIADRVGVMYLGKIVEEATAEELFRNPQHPYTKSLLSAVPIPIPVRKVRPVILQGEVPSPLNPPPGCTFHPRCPIAKECCAINVPSLEEKSPLHFAACHFVDTRK